MNNIRIDEFLEIIKNMELRDIKNLCKTNTHIFNLCNEYKHIIFNDVIYILQYDIHIDSCSDKIISGIFKDINKAIKEMNRQYNIQLSIMNKKSQENSHYTFSFYNNLFECNLEDDNGRDDDKSYKWKITAHKINS